MAANDNLSLVDKALRSGNCGDAIRYMRCYLSAWPEQHTAEKVTLLGEDYDRMVAYWQQGGKRSAERTALSAIVAAYVCDICQRSALSSHEGITLSE